MEETATGSRSGAAGGPCNEVVLRGRLSGDPRIRELPSGATLATFRVVVARERTTMTAASRQVSDWVQCGAWSATMRRRVLAWADGDEVEVRGALRRRFFRTGDQARSSLELEALSGRLVRRAAARGRQSGRAASG